VLISLLEAIGILLKDLLDLIEVTVEVWDVGAVAPTSRISTVSTSVGCIGILGGGSAKLASVILGGTAARGKLVLEWACAHSLGVN